MAILLHETGQPDKALALAKVMEDHPATRRVGRYIQQEHRRRHAANRLLSRLDVPEAASNLAKPARRRRFVKPLIGLGVAALIRHELPVGLQRPNGLDGRRRAAGPVPLVRSPAVAFHGLRCPVWRRAALHPWLQSSAPLGRTATKFGRIEA